MLLARRTHGIGDGRPVLERGVSGSKVGFIYGIAIVFGMQSCKLPRMRLPLNGEYNERRILFGR